MLSVVLIASFGEVLQAALPIRRSFAVTWTDLGSILH